MVTNTWAEAPHRAGASLRFPVWGSSPDPVLRVFMERSLCKHDCSRDSHVKLDGTEGPSLLLDVVGEASSPRVLEPVCAARLSSQGVGRTPLKQGFLIHSDKASQNLGG